MNNKNIWLQKLNKEGCVKLTLALSVYCYIEKTYTLLVVTVYYTKLCVGRGVALARSRPQNKSQNYHQILGGGTGCSILPPGSQYLCSYWLTLVCAFKGWPLIGYSVLPPQAVPYKLSKPSPDWWRWHRAPPVGGSPAVGLPPPDYMQEGGSRHSL